MDSMQGLQVLAVYDATTPATLVWVFNYFNVVQTTDNSAVDRITWHSWRPRNSFYEANILQLTAISDLTMLITKDTNISAAFCVDGHSSGGQGSIHGGGYCAVEVCVGKTKTFKMQRQKSNKFRDYWNHSERKRPLQLAC
jgi:hypothetical protein